MLIVRRLPHPPDQRCELAEDIPFLRGLIFVSNMGNVPITVGFIGIRGRGATMSIIRSRNDRLDGYGMAELPR
jgi:hypothetical protein